MLLRWAPQVPAFCFLSLWREKERTTCDRSVTCVDHTPGRCTGSNTQVIGVGNIKTCVVGSRPSSPLFLLIAAAGR